MSSPTEIGEPPDPDARWELPPYPPVGVPVEDDEADEEPEEEPDGPEDPRAAGQPDEGAADPA